MGTNPYKDLPSSAFWKTGVTEENPFLIEEIYKKKFDIKPQTKIATAGSCFAQNISIHLKKNGYSVLDVEPPPISLPSNLHKQFGFSIYSARYGNIYTVRQLLQLAQEVSGERIPENYIWEKDGKYFDALRPSVEPEGLSSPEEVVIHRKHHILRVKKLFSELDLLIFTFGLTEMWVHKDSKTVYPTAPGTIAGDFNQDKYSFENAQFLDILNDFINFQEVLKKIRGNRSFNILLSVSPVPLTASASGKHILLSNSYSKSTLISVANQLSLHHKNIDYFPSYEIITNPRLHSTSFSQNLRTVRNEAVENVMKHFFDSHKKLDIFPSKQKVSVEEQLNRSQEDLQCEEALTDAFRSKK